VATRWRSLTGLPLASSSMALSPEPPMSMVMVMGWDEALMGRMGGVEGVDSALGVISNEL